MRLGNDPIQVETASLSSEEIALLGELAREIAPDLPRIAQGWELLAAEHLPTPLIDAPLALAQRLLATIAAEDIDAAIELCVAQGREFAECRLSGRAGPCRSLDELFGALAIPRSTLEAEIIRHNGGDAERTLKALLCFARLWTRMAERFAATYASVIESKPRAGSRKSPLLESTLTARLAHEIRTPLNVILGYADMMADRLQELGDPAGARYGALVRRAGERLLGMISAVLELSKANAGLYDLKPAPLNLGVLIRREVEELMVLAHRKNIELKCVIEEPDAEILFDERCLTGALANLIHNAIKFTVKGGVTVRAYRDDTGALRLEVRDTGAGIDPAYQPRVFEPFTRENSPGARAAEGSGLGLALARRYVELNGAKISVWSIKNVGSCFTILFAKTGARARARGS